MLNALGKFVEGQREGVVGIKIPEGSQDALEPLVDLEGDHGEHFLEVSALFVNLFSLFSRQIILNICFLILDLAHESLQVLTRRILVPNVSNFDGYEVEKVDELAQLTDRHVTPCGALFVDTLTLGMVLGKLRFGLLLRLAVILLGRAQHRMILDATVTMSVFRIRFRYFNYRQEQIVNNFLLVFRYAPKCGEEHLVELFDLHQPVIVLDLLVHVLPHVVEDAVVHAELLHFLDDAELLLILLVVILMDHSEDVTFNDARPQSRGSLLLVLVDVQIYFFIESHSYFRLDRLAVEAFTEYEWLLSKIVGIFLMISFTFQASLLVDLVKYLLPLFLISLLLQLRYFINLQLVADSLIW